MTKNRFHFHSVIAIIVVIIIITVAWVIWITPASECSRCLGIHLKRNAVTDVFETDYGTVYFLRVSVLESTLISSKLSANALDVEPTKFIPELVYRKKLGSNYKCYRMNNYHGGKTCHVVLFSDTLTCVVMVIEK